MQLLRKLTVLLALLPALTFADDNATKGLAIMTEVGSRNSGWVDSTSRVDMILRNRNGQESRRELRNKVLEVADDGDKSLIIFDTPRDVQNTAFLSFSHINDADEQWLYLPALKRVKRIASRNKSGPFMGSEFSYEDMSSFELEKYAYKFLREETLDGQPCFVVESIPVDKLSGYTRQELWIDQAEYRIQKIDFYDRKHSLLKTLTAKNYQLYEDKFWRPDSQLMVNHQSGKSTDLHIHDLTFGNDLQEKDFTKNALMRAR